jgi:hypothetical protein
MRSPTYALLWEIWRRHRSTVAVILGLTVAGRLLEVSERTGGDNVESSPLVTLLQMVSFALLFGIFNYTDSSGSRGLGGFPHRLFTLPVSSLRLVTIPVLTGIASVEVLHLLWLDASKSGSMSPPFVAVLLGALMVFFQAVLWTLERLGPLRLVGMGAVAVVVFGIGLLPSFPPTPAPLWRSEPAMAALVAGAAVLAFLLTLNHVASLRSGGGRRPQLLEPVIAAALSALPRRRRAFASPAAAHFWFEWRCSGLPLPVLVGGVLLVIIGPFSWVARDDAGGSLRLLVGTLAMPIILAIPVGMAFARPTFWSEDLSVPDFVAVRPLTDEDLVAVKLKVAAASVLMSWLLVLSFLALWMLLWADLDTVSQLAIVLWAFHGHSVAAVYGIAVLVVIAGIFLTWRLLVSRLWSGLSGSRPLFITSFVSVVVVAIAGIAFDAARLPGWLLDDPARTSAVVWIVAIAVAAKYWLAAWSWRRVSARYSRLYLLLWGAGTTCFVLLAVVLWGVLRIHVAMDAYRVQGLIILLALAAVPLGRVGLAPSSFARNRHR